MTTNDLIPFVAILAASVSALATLAGVRLANTSSERQLMLRLQHQDEKDQKEALRLRLEELYQLIDEWSKAMVAHYATYRSVMDGQLTYNQALDMTISRKIEFKVAWLFTLAELYFPKSHENLDIIKSSRENLARIEGAFREIYREQGLLRVKVLLLSSPKKCVVLVKQSTFIKSLGLVCARGITSRCR